MRAGAEDRVMRDAVPDRVIGAALGCIGRWGVAKTTLDDVAREAGCSRATLYRAFPGGKDVLLRAVAVREVSSLMDSVRARLDAADDLEDALVGAIAEAGRIVTGHAALQFVLAYEPEVVLPELAFSGMDRALRAAGALIGPHLTRWLGPDDADRAAQWLCRLVVSYLTCPSPEVEVQDEESVRRLVRRFVVPALTAGLDHSSSGGPGCRNEPVAAGR
ncbi:MAG TPA: TetR/AcrR family transcriptional regulator [Acidimicrobiales bacterium]|nr:TetR/AcrR family transcriptional regulator [Acidimicrobiales bacterium]